MSWIKKCLNRGEEKIRIEKKSEFDHLTFIHDHANFKLKQHFLSLSKNLISNRKQKMLFKCFEKLK